MASLSEEIHLSKTIVYFIQIIQAYFESSCNVMAPNPLIITFCLS